MMLLFLAVSYTIVFCLYPITRSSKIPFHATKSKKYQRKPKQLGIYFDPDGSLVGHQIFNQWLYIHQQHPNVFVEDGALKRQEQLKNSYDYWYGSADPLEHDYCVRQYEWQASSFPSCNTLHEIDLTRLYESETSSSYVKLFTHGYWRDVWYVRDFQRKIVLKTLRYEHCWEERNYDRHRRDAVAADRLTKSPYVVDIFGFCGNSALGEYGQGDLYSYIERETDPKSYLRIAYQIASGIADLHNSDKEGVASIAHTDITPGQFILIDGVYKLNDFNRCRFITWNNSTMQSCPFHVGENPGKFRSPEEYMHLNQTEKIDVYSMGNIFYYMLSKEWPYEKMRSEKAQAKVSKGLRPELPDHILNSTDVNVKSLVKAIEMSWVQDPLQRSSAREVQEYLRSKIK